MAFIRQETNFTKLSLTANADVDISTYDRVGRVTADAEAVATAADETAEFLFLESADMDDPISVAFMGQGRAKLRLSGTGTKGQKLSTGAGGFIVAGTAAGNEADQDDFGFALEAWVDEQETECFIQRGVR